MDHRHSIEKVFDCSDETQTGKECNSSSNVTVVQQNVTVSSWTMKNDNKISGFDESEKPHFYKVSRSLKNRHEPIVEQHSYHDHANDPITLDNSGMDPLCDFVGCLRPFSFPSKLYNILNKAKLEGFDDVIGWQPHGRCFVIHKQDVFARDILPKYFYLQKIESFQRQLNLYGFKRLTKIKDKNGYYNELFLRGRIDLVQTIVRVKIKGTKIRGKRNPIQEPDFWESIPWIPDDIQNHFSQDNNSVCTSTNEIIMKADKFYTKNEEFISPQQTISCFPNNVIPCSTPDHQDISWISLSAKIQNKLNESVQWLSMLQGQMGSSSSHTGSAFETEELTDCNSARFVGNGWVETFHGAEININSKIGFQNNHDGFHSSLVDNSEEHDFFTSLLDDIDMNYLESIPREVLANDSILDDFLVSLAESC